MAKKKVIRKAEKASKKAGAAKAVEAPVVVEQKKNSIIPAVIAVIVVLFIAFEFYMVMAREKRMSMKPLLAAQWKPVYKSVICTVVYNNDFILIDERLNHIQLQDKMTGVIKGVFEAVNGQPMWVAEIKDGTMYTIQKNSNVMWEIKNNKKVREFVMADIKSPSGIVADSKDTLFVSDQGGNIVNYSVDGKKLGAFNGMNSGDKISGSVTRLFIDKNDNLYALTGNPCGVKIYNPAGKVKAEFKLPNNEICALANLAVTPDGNIYINDFNGTQVLVYNPTGVLIDKFSKDSASSFIITYPGTLAGGPDGYIYVGTHDIGVFSPIKF
jgi:outer membrane protein assembly factor BamB